MGTHIAQPRRPMETSASCLCSVVAFGRSRLHKSSASVLGPSIRSGQQPLEMLRCRLQALVRLLCCQCAQLHDAHEAHRHSAQPTPSSAASFTRHKAQAQVMRVAWAHGTWHMNTRTRIPPWPIPLPVVPQSRVPPRATSFHLPPTYPPRPSPQPCAHHPCGPLSLPTLHLAPPPPGGASVQRPDDARRFLRGGAARRTQPD
jgi:hypothetical protein